MAFQNTSRPITSEKSKVIQRSLDKVGGIFMSELFVPDIEPNSKAAISVGQNNSGCAVVEVRAQKKVDEAKLALEMAEEFHQVSISSLFYTEFLRARSPKA